MDTELDRDQAEAEEAVESRRSRLPLYLRNAALVLLLVGFGGALATDTAPVALDSVYSYLFFAGVACAIAAVYLGIFGGGNSTDS